MSLRLKFSVLLAVMTLAVLGVSAMAIWSLATLERQLSLPFNETTDALRRLRQISEAADESVGLMRAGGNASWTNTTELGGPFIRPDPDDAAALDMVARDLRAALDGLAALPSLRVPIGVSTKQTLRAEADQAITDAKAWIASGEPADAASSTRGWRRLRMLSDRLQGRILEDADLASEFSDALRGRLLVVLAISVGMTLLAGVLALALFGRWLVVPIERLRIATERFGSGDLIHRVNIPGKDELASLGNEVNEMASLIQVMQREAIDRERLAAIGEVAQGLAHNIRNPIAGIRMMAEVSIAQLEQQGSAAEETIESQRRIIGTVDRFERWVADLLGATNPIAPSRRTVEVLPVLEGAAASHHAMAVGKGVAIEVQCRVATANIDPRHIEQAIAALVANAIQHAPSNSSVHISAEAEGSTLVLRISDEGPGVPEELRERIFSPAFTGRSGGTGMGLALARQAARAHGGETRVDPDWQAPSGSDGSTPSGASFVIEIPGARRGG